ncbi:MAG: class I SAM-dependent methyltransferase [Pyrinomonadaceae bacterium]|nr:class I SAM-dependent methyltransferase [Pyrinomonadaceae bacterium]
MKIATSDYDSFPYPSYTFPQTHPDRLASIGRIHGIEVKDPTRCRMLEIGCGDGSNLLSLAYALPGSEFVGFDLSEKHIARGISAKHHIGIKNIHLFQADALLVDVKALGRFDYIVAHGIFSWVPANVRDRILQIFSECLEESGIGYISYNAYPGCHIREIAAGILKAGSAEVEVPAERVEKGIAFLDAIAAAAESDSLYQKMLRLELEQIRERSDQNVFHDDLADCNFPFYFRDFVSMIEPHGLQFISESDPIASNVSKLSREARALLEGVRTDVIRFEQYIDLITCRRFRSSLVCRTGLSVDYPDSVNDLEGMYLSAQVTTDADEGSLVDGSTVRFEGSKGASFTINHPLTKSIMANLGSIWPAALPFEDLVSEAEIRINGRSAEDESRTRAYLYQLYLGGFVKFGCYSPAFAKTAGELPISSAFARWQISEGLENLTTLAGKNLKTTDPVLRLVISLLDGTRGRDELVEEIFDATDVPDGEREAFLAALPDIVEGQLAQIAAAGLLLK